MKKIIFIFGIIAFFAMFVSPKTFAQNETKGFVGGRVSYLIWDNSGFSDYFGGTTIFGANVGLILSEDFKLEGFGNFGEDAYEEVKMNFSEIGGAIKYSWYAFGGGRPNIYGGFGASSISIKFSEPEYTEKGNSFGFSLKAGVEIPLGGASFLDLGWTSTWSKMNFPKEEETLDVGNMYFHAGLLFAF